MRISCYLFVLMIKKEVDKSLQQEQLDAAREFVRKIRKSRILNRNALNQRAVSTFYPNS